MVNIIRVSGSVKDFNLCRPLRGLTNLRESDPRVTLAALARFTRGYYLSLLRGWSKQTSILAWC
jgi:hypothetical protein